jgi:hypothetical protein
MYFIQTQLINAIKKLKLMGYDVGMWKQIATKFICNLKRGNSFTGAIQL